MTTATRAFPKRIKVQQANSYYILTKAKKNLIIFIFNAFEIAILIQN